MSSYLAFSNYGNDLSKLESKKYQLLWLNVVKTMLKWETKDWKY